MDSTFLAEAKRLLFLQQQFEKNENPFKLLTKYEFDCHVEENKYLNRLADNEKNINAIKTVFRQLEENKIMLTNNKLMSLNLNGFKENMVTIQDQIQYLQIKTKSNLKDMLDIEKELVDSLLTYNQKQETWERPIKLTNSCLKTNGQVASENTNTEFLVFVQQSNGHENGWSSREHHLFLKYRMKYHNKKFYTKLHTIVPHLSFQEIDKHEKWYQKYVSLKNKQKLTLETWNHNKAPFLKDKEDQIVEGNSIESITKNKKIYKQDPALVKMKVAEWKLIKETQIKQMQCAERENKIRMEVFHRNKQIVYEEIKKTIANWKQIKESNKNYIQIQNEIRESQERQLKAQQANKLIKKFQSQDDLYITKMQKIRQMQKNNKLQNRSKSSILVDRKPERLLQPTIQWLLRINRDDNAAKSIFIPNIKTVPKLKTPAWRKT